MIVGGTPDEASDDEAKAAAKKRAARPGKANGNFWKSIFIMIDQATLNGTRPNSPSGVNGKGPGRRTGLSERGPGEFIKVYKTGPGAPGPHKPRLGREARKPARLLLSRRGPHQPSGRPFSYLPV